LLNNRLKLIIIIIIIIITCWCSELISFSYFFMISWVVVSMLSNKSFNCFILEKVMIAFVLKIHDKIKISRCKKAKKTSLLFCSSSARCASYSCSFKCNLLSRSVFWRSQRSFLWCIIVSTCLSKFFISNSLVFDRASADLTTINLKMKIYSFFQYDYNLKNIQKKTNKKATTLYLWLLLLVSRLNSSSTSDIFE
jgi:hypothetical protein